MKVCNRGPLEAEQFNSSEEQAKKLGIIRYRGHWYFPTLRGDQEVLNGDWIVNKSNSGTCIITDEEFKQQYAELPVIPKNVANYLTDCKRANTTIGTSLSGNIVLFSHARSHDMIHDILSWLCPSDNQDLFARAWLDGYKVEADK